MNDYVIRMAAYAVKKYKSRNPFDIIEQRKINFAVTENLVDTLGFYAVVSNRRFIRLSAYANKIQQLMGAGHELGHDFCDRREAATSGPFRDTFFYSLDTSRQERRANIFSAELLIEDQKILEPIGYFDFQELLATMRRKYTCSEKELLLYAQQEFSEIYDQTTTEMVSREIGLDPVLVEFKYQALKEKGLLLPVEPNLDNTYLSGLMNGGGCNDFDL